MPNLKTAIKPKKFGKNLLNQFALPNAFVLSDLSRKNLKIKRRASKNNKNAAEDPFLPMLQIPSSVIKKNINQMRKRKSRSESRSIVASKVSRNPEQLITNFSNFSHKSNQKSTDTFEVSSKKIVLRDSNKEEKKQETKKISIFAGFRTIKGYNPKKLEKPNQDRMLIASKFNNCPLQWVFWVFDGHGTDGHKVSQFARDNFCNCLLKQKFTLMAKSKMRQSDYHSQEPIKKDLNKEGRNVCSSVLPQNNCI